MTTFQAYMVEQRLESDQDVVVTEEFISDYLEAGNTRGQLQLDDDTCLLSPDSMDQRYREALAYCDGAFGLDFGNPARSPRVILWLIDHSTHCWLLSGLPRGAQEMYHQEWLDLMHRTYQAHKACYSRGDRAVHATMGVFMSIQKQTLFSGKTLTTLYLNDFVVPGGERGSGLRALLQAVRAGQALPERLLIWPKDIKGCRGGINTQQWELASTGNEETCPMFWLLSSLLDQLWAGRPLQHHLMLEKVGWPEFVDKAMPVEAFCDYIAKLQGAGGKHYTGLSLRKGGAQELARQGKSMYEIGVMLGNAGIRALEEDMKIVFAEFMERLQGEDEQD